MTKLKGNKWKKLGSLNTC